MSSHLVQLVIGSGVWTRTRTLTFVHNASTYTGINCQEFHLAPSVFIVTQISSGLVVVAGTDLRHKALIRRRRACLFAWAILVSQPRPTAHQPAHSPQRKEHLTEDRSDCLGWFLSSLNALTCCVPIINHSGPLRRICLQGVGRPCWLTGYYAAIRTTSSFAFMLLVRF